MDARPPARLPARPPRYGVVAAYLGTWTAIGAAFAVQNYAASAVKGYPIIWQEAFAWSFNDWAAWALVAPAAIWAAGRWPLGTDQWRERIPPHLLLMAATVSVHALLVYGAERAEGLFFDPAMSFGAGYRYYLVKKSVFDGLVYWTIVGLVHTLSYYRLYRDREVRAAQLETRLARTQLQVLRAQLQPHFLFNTLNSISALMHRDVEAADRMVTRLGDLLRLSLTHTERQEVSLRQELEFLERYLDIQRTRFRDRLTVTVTPDPEALDALVPSLVLQPIVENAIRYAIEPRAGPGRVDIRAGLEEDLLVIEVADDGPGLPAKEGASGNGGCGIGLANTRARLEQLYGDAHRFTLGRRVPSGLVVRIEIPFRMGALPTPVVVRE